PKSCDPSASIVRAGAGAAGERRSIACESSAGSTSTDRRVGDRSGVEKTGPIGVVGVGWFKDAQDQDKRRPGTREGGSRARDTERTAPRPIASQSRNAAGRPDEGAARLRGSAESKRPGDPVGRFAGSDQVDGGVVRGAVSAGAGGGGGVSEGGTVGGVAA